MSRIFNDKEESLNVLGESLTNLTWLHHLNVAAIMTPTDKSEENTNKDDILRLPSSSEIVQYATDESEKPPYSYTTLIGLAFHSLKADRLNVGQMCDWISSRFPFYQTYTQMWQNCVRHNLQQSRLFERVRKRRDDRHRGVLWRISAHVRIECVSDEEEVGDESTKRKRPPSLFCTENYLMGGGENQRNKKRREEEYDYSWDSLVPATQKEDWFPSYPTEKTLFDDFERAGPVFEDFDESKMTFPDFYMGGEYCDTADIPEFTSAIHFDPLLSSTWSTSTQGSDSSREGHVHYSFDTEGLHYN
ncbi:fork head protein homolog 2-like [Octopus sinensis]|uniref:Fork head protein homolog 2-like n=1 Tax=Octopus sinensis TaxID=2607531 RepID=A0A6P7U0N0_9MOLL|nr:fork head protein homolog 2-like [Octopus sinensis]